MGDMFCFKHCDTDFRHKAAKSSTVEGNKMTPGIKPLIAGNWKMNGLKASLAEIETVAAALGASPPKNCEAALCVPTTLLISAVEAASGALSIGAEDCHANASGAHTGDISAEMIADCGASYIIVGHSERRADHGESNADVKAKAEACYRSNLSAIICVGETEAERRAGDALRIVESQMAASIPDSANATNTIIAYEPVWAIGTGLTPTAEDVAEMHLHMRNLLASRFGDNGKAMRLLYGGSMKPSNASELLGVDHVDGGLIGGASLKANDFLGIIAACEAL